MAEKDCKDTENEEVLEEVKKDVEEVVEEAEVIEKTETELQADKITSLEEEVKKLQDGLLRKAAEVENFKKRLNDERIKERKYATMSVCSKMLEPIDYFEKALNFETDDKNFINFLKGFKMIKEQLFNVLNDEGVTEIKALGEEFDPTIHQAVATENVDKKKNNIVLEELQKGYKFKDRVIKPSMVKVNQK